MLTLDYKKYAEVSRNLCADSCVLLKNDGVLPFEEGLKLSVFGRVAIDTYYCGTGSGGMVNLPYLVTILDGLKSKFQVNEELVERYQEFIQENPFDKGQGWAQEPFSQVELALSKEQVTAARASSDVAVYVVGRSAGEDKDCLPEAGSYYLTETEKDNIRLIQEQFQRCLVMLNVGGVLDMSWVEELNPSAVMYAWHGGCESGNGYADVISGAVNPSGSMPDTIACSLEANISTKNFGDLEKNYYQEDIYVGYRYFETFATKEVRYPFGFGLSYTDFTITDTRISWEEEKLLCYCKVTNTGKVSGKKAVQVYMEAPQGRLGKAKKVLVAFQKTKVLQVGESQELCLAIQSYDFASYDEEQSKFVLEQGNYAVHVGFDVRSTKIAGNFDKEAEEVILECKQALAPVENFTVLKASGGEEVEASYVAVKTRNYDVKDRMLAARKEVPKQVRSAFSFKEVMKGTITCEEFVNQLSDLDLIHISRGEGMCSPKVTSGTAGCIGGVTERLAAFDLPIICCADGPSGIRMDSGTMAYSIPNGTAIASTFDTDLVEQLFGFVGLELVKNNIDTLLGPGMNIHRNPLCGRNFEYFSEDPFLTGKMAVAELKAMQAYDVTGTIKHFAANSQENRRREVDSIVSERALREIYLKAFEMAVKEGEARCIMTAYNPINGVQAASNFDLNTSILREEWGFDGLVMSDWWATMNHEGGDASEAYTDAMILSQNDVYMVNGDALTNSNKDNSEEKLEEGVISRYELLRNAKNVVKAMTKLICAKGKQEVEVINEPEHSFTKKVDLGEFVVDGDTLVDTCNIQTTKGTYNNFALQFKETGNYSLEIQLESNAIILAQMPMTVSANGTHLKTITLNGTMELKEEIGLHVQTNINTYVELFFGESGLSVKEMKVVKK